MYAYLGKQDYFLAILTFLLVDIFVLNSFLAPRELVIYRLGFFYVT